MSSALILSIDPVDGEEAGAVTFSEAIPNDARAIYQMLVQPVDNSIGSKAFDA